MRILDRSLSRFPKWLRTLIDWSLTIAFTITAILVFQAEIAKPFRIPSSSMETSLHCARPGDGCTARFSDRVIANRLVYRFHAPRRGDIVVFETPAGVAATCEAGGIYVKRIVGLPGERVTMRDGVVFVDGERLDEPYLDPARRGSQTGTWPRVPGDAYFVLGDNRASSCDSRRWGVVPRENVIGRVDVRYWPPGRIGSP